MLTVGANPVRGMERGRIIPLERFRGAAGRGGVDFQIRSFFGLSFRPVPLSVLMERRRVIADV